MVDRLPGDAGSAPAKTESVRLGVVFERRRIDHPWQQWRWLPVAVIPGAALISEPRLLRRGEDWAWYHVASLDLELFAGETQDYCLNLSQKPPAVYVLWRFASGDPESLPEPFHVTVCHSETQDYLDGGDVMAEGVPMPEPIRRLLEDYVRAYHVERPFKKRKPTPMAPPRDAGGEYG
jgi:hypothetical protein